jgi:hypothetical protein
MRFRWNPETFSKMLYFLWGPPFIACCIVFVFLTRNEKNMHRDNWIALAIVLLATLAIAFTDLAWWWLLVPTGIAVAFVLVGTVILGVTGKAPSPDRNR